MKSDLTINFVMAKGICKSCSKISCHNISEYAKWKTEAHFVILLINQSFMIGFYFAIPSSKWFKTLKQDFLQTGFATTARQWLTIIAYIQTLTILYNF